MRKVVSMARSNNSTAVFGAVVITLLLSTASIAQQMRSGGVVNLKDRSPRTASARSVLYATPNPSRNTAHLSDARGMTVRPTDTSPKRGSSQRTSKHTAHGVQPASVQLLSEHDVILAPGVSAPLNEFGGVEEVEMWGAEHSVLELGCDSCGMASQCCCNPVGALFDWSRADVWFGMNAFTGAANFLTTGSDARGQVEGNFGFQEGFNFGSRVPSLLSGQVGSQIGMRFTHTQLDGSIVGDDSRNQMFLTAGLFRRVDYGLQGGLVVDYLHDDWIYQADLVQLRGELSFLFSPCHDFGFRFTDSQQVEELDVTIRGAAAPLSIQLAALNNYRFFYRYRFSERGRGLAELQAGFTEDSGAVLGVSLKTPLQGQLGLETSATYLLPADDAIEPYQSESWNLGIGFVWTPGRLFGTGRDYYRPLLDVADNGSFLTRLRRF